MPQSVYKFGNAKRVILDAAINSVIISSYATGPPLAVSITRPELSIIRKNLRQSDGKSFYQKLTQASYPALQ